MRHFDEWVTLRIERYVHDDPVVGAILIALAIDWLCGFWSGEQPTGSKYADFIKSYFPKGYDGIRVYRGLRCGLAHGFTLGKSDEPGTRYVLTHDHPEEHLCQDEQGRTRLDVRAFHRDWIAAKNRYFDEVREDTNLLKNWQTRYQGSGFLDLSLSQLTQSDAQPPAGVMATAASYSTDIPVSGGRGCELL